MAPAQKSIVWSFFEISPDKLFATCKLCSQKLKYFTSTGNLKLHITRKHPIQYSEHLRKENPSETPDQETLTEGTPDSQTIKSNDHSVANEAEILPVASTSSTCDNMSLRLTTSVKRVSTSSSNQITKQRRQLKLFGGKNSNELSEEQKTKCDLSLLKLIAKDFQPLSIVENSGFLEYSKTLNPLYKVPSRNILTNNLLSTKYLEEVTKLKSKLQEVKYVSLTTDIWQSDSNISYLSLTCHFVHDMTLHSRVLSVNEMSSIHHTGQNIAADISAILTEWDLDAKIVTIVSDNGANVKNAITVHLRKYHHPCVAHTLNLISKEALNENPELKKLITKCKNLVAYFKHSAIATGKLKKCQEDMGEPILKVKQAVETRWNSILIMLERLLLIKNPLSVAIANLPTAPDFIDAAEWNIISEYVPLLKPLELMTTELSGEKYVTMSTVIPLTRGLQLSIRNLKPNTEMGLWLQSKLLETISKRLGILESNKIWPKAHFLTHALRKLPLVWKKMLKMHKCGYWTRFLQNFAFQMLKQKQKLTQKRVLRIRDHQRIATSQVIQ
ncbi:unnamed protein product [Brassicogethes aeneus]|uniref:BED-type domain-containing protein n=1 Tax=Brassicogethes aeneus TaxID=1431903 RepID=A0A9P0FL41_BRAAE|nr:unnamed protein product [Brassicogethes aeneus]